MAITFNDVYADNIGTVSYGVWYRDESANTTTSRGAGQNVDLFPDTGVAVDDCILFGLYYGAKQGKYNELRLNLQTALAATAITGVWEYPKRNAGSATSLTWTALSDVVDGTNAFQNTGTNSVTFTIPDDWENHLLPWNQAIYYYWYIRFRITALDTLTEGGKTANTTTAVEFKPYTIWVSGYDSTDPCTMQDIYDADVAGGWGVVAKNNNQYSLTANIEFATDNYFSSQNEMIEMQKNWQWNAVGGATMQIGSLTGDKPENGSVWQFLGYNCNYGSSGLGILGEDSYFYNSQVKFINMSGSTAIQGYWGAGLFKNNVKVNGSYFQDMRQVAFNNYLNSYKDIMVNGAMIENPGGVIDSITVYGVGFGARTGDSATAGHESKIHRCNISDVTSSPINCYGSTVNQNFVFDAVDCNYGSFSDLRKVIWYHGSTYYTPVGVYETYSALLRAVGEDGNPISGASVVIKDTNGTTVHSLTTNVDGYAGTDSGTVTGHDINKLYFDDSSKSWTASNSTYDGLEFSEFFLTSDGVDGSAVLDDGLEDWTSSTNLTNWTESVSGTSSVNRESTEIHGGTYSAKLTVDASNSNVSITKSSITLTSGKSYKLSFWYKQSAFSKSWVLYLRDSTSTVYLGPTGVWTTGGFTIPYSTEWTYYELKFTAHPSYTNYQLIFQRSSAASTSMYIDDVKIEPCHNSWKERRIVLSNTATRLTAHTPFAKYVGIDDRYIFIPYIRAKKFLPISYTTLVNTVSSSVTDYNPFTITISKSGYKTYSEEVTLTGPIDKEVTLQKVKNLNLSKHAKIFTQ